MIKADLIVKNLLISGTLSTVNQNNGVWVDTLKDIIYKTDSKPIHINGEKIFPDGVELKNGLFLSGLINDYNVSEFLRLDSHQIITGKFFKLIDYLSNKCFILISGLLSQIFFSYSYLSNDCLYFEYFRCREIQ